MRRITKPTIETGTRHRNVTVFTLPLDFWPDPQDRDDDGCWLGHRLRAKFVRWIEDRDILVLNCTAVYGRGFPLVVSDQRYGSKPPEWIKGKPKCHTRDCRAWATGLGPVEPAIIDVAAGWDEWFEPQQGHWWGRGDTTDDTLGHSEPVSDDVFAQKRQWVEVTAPPVASRFRAVWAYCFDDGHADALQSAVCGLDKVDVKRTILRPTDL